MSIEIIGKQEALGIGKPDFSKEVSLGQVRPGIRLKYNQRLKVNAVVFSAIPSPYSWCFLPLVPGASQHIIDLETGLELPYTVPQGWCYSVITRRITFSEDCSISSYVDVHPITGDPLLIISAYYEGGRVNSSSEIVGLATTLIDLNASRSHPVDSIITNIGAGNLEGAVSDIILMEAIGTPPPPTTKTVRCKWCGYQTKVSVKTNQLECPKCGKLTLYYNLQDFRSSS